MTTPSDGATMTDHNKVQDNKAESRFELRVAGETAIAAYERGDGVIRFTHTVVPEAIGLMQSALVGSATLYALPTEAFAA